MQRSASDNLAATSTQTLFLTSLTFLTLMPWVNKVSLVKENVHMYLISSDKRFLGLTQYVTLV